MTSLDVLRRMRDLFAEDDAWYPHAPAKNRRPARVGFAVGPTSADAVCWSLGGAMEYVSGWPSYCAGSPSSGAVALLRRALHLPDLTRLSDWERALGRAPAEVFDAIDAAILFGEAEDQNRYAQRVYISCNLSTDPCPLGTEFSILWGQFAPGHAWHQSDTAWWAGRTACA